MRALRLAGGRLERIEREVGAAPAGEARVRVRLAGICSTDLELVRGYMGFEGTPGHEFVGEVIDGPAELDGARVVGEINAACDDCPTCGAGRHRHCPRRTVLGILGRDGAHAEELCLPVANLHRVDDAIPDEVAVFVEPLAAAWHAFEQVPVAGRTVAVLGLGKLGQLLARCARVAGGRVTGVGRSQRSRALAAAAGIDAVARDEVGEERFDVVVDATGAASGLGLALELVRPLGDVILKTTTHDPSSVALAPVVIDEVRITGSRCGPFAAALDLLRRGAIDPTPLVSAVHDLDRGVEAYAEAARAGVLKVLLRP